MILVGDMVEIQDRTGVENRAIEGQWCYVLAIIRGPMYGDYEGLLLEDIVGDKFAIPLKQVKLIKNGGINK
ncbi:hypothetical protein HXA92_12180 [Listeria monocytogenes]|nr:hypothetical protein [Listeria monocytogenes]HEL8334684.1 hypothetical protein [Listeria monocytogenes]